MTKRGFKHYYSIPKMSIELIIDTRERELILSINNLKTPPTFKVEQLDIGDILFRNKKENGDTILIIERKTVSDLKASICDGRHREQKARLLGTTPKNRIMYLVEGSMVDSSNSNNSANRGVPISTLVGSLINTQLRDDIKVYKTSCIEESANFVAKMLDKLEKDGDAYFLTEENTSKTYVSTLKTSKKANMTPEVWYKAQLSLIPQVTDKIASVITEMYPTLQKMLSSYESIPEHLRPKLLSDITYKVGDTGKKRRIGDKISRRLYEYFYGIENELVEVSG